MATVRYQALGPLLSGEGSRAFLGLQIQNEERAHPVVLVWVPEESLGDEELLQRLANETRHAASLEHPNIIRVHGLATLDEGVARVVEFADGESVTRLLKECRHLPARFAAKVVADAALGVHYAHMAGTDDGTPLIHGYLCPDTVIVSYSGAVKVAGYGALNLAPRAELRRSYFAPEQVIAGREATTRQTDVFLLGLLLYECLTGDEPFSHEPDHASAVLNSPLPPILSEEVSQPLRDVVNKATAKRAADRYESAMALREALEAALGTIPTNDELGAFLSERFAGSNDVRATRRREIDAGIADFARRQWELKDLKAREAQLSPPLPPPSSLPPPEEPAYEEFEEEEEAAPAPRRRTGLWVISAVVLIAVTAAVYVLRFRPAPVPSAPPAAVEAAAPPAPVPVAPPAPPPPVMEAAAVEPTPPPAPEMASLELVVEPAVNLRIGDRDLGRSPFSGPMKPGKHTVTLVDEKKGIRTSRTIQVKPEGKTTERIYLKKGYVTVRAPAGATIYVDGRKVGKGPKSELGLYEGRHKLLVTVGKARWQQAFTVRPGERMNFDVGMK